MHKYKIYTQKKFEDSVLKLQSKEKEQFYKIYGKLNIETDTEKVLKNYGCHRVDKISKSDHYWSLTVNKKTQIRLIIYKKAPDLCLCYIDHHDKAYKWCETHQTKYNEERRCMQSYSLPSPEDHAIKYTNQIPENLKENPLQVQPIFSKVSDEQMLSAGVPEEWIPPLKKMTNEEQFGKVMSKLPQVPGYILLSFIIDGKSFEEVLKEFTPPDKNLKNNPNGFDHPDSINYFRVVTDYKELEQALGNSWDDWLVYLDVRQQQLVCRNYNGPSKIFGAAGTGKTVVALHRVKYLTQNSPNSRICLITFSKVLADDLERKLCLLFKSSNLSAENIKVYDIQRLAEETRKLSETEQYFVSKPFTIREKLKRIIKKHELDKVFPPNFIISEYEKVVGPWNLWDFNKYKNFQRLGRGTPLRENHRQALSFCFQELQDELKSENRLTPFELYYRAADLTKNSNFSFDHVVVDECQDLGPHMLEFIRSLVPPKQNDIMLCGDSGQALYQRYHSYAQHGLSVQGRSKNLAINYRTSKEIKDFSEKLTDTLATLDDGTKENRKTISKFNGPEPEIRFFDTPELEVENLTNWVKGLLENERLGIKAHEIAILARTENLLKPIKKSLENENIKAWILDHNANYLVNEIGLAEISRAKGLEFKCVAIVSCNEEHFPSEEKLREIKDAEERNQFLELEKNLLYVGATRARDVLYISGISPGSEFLEDLI